MQEILIETLMTQGVFSIARDARLSDAIAIMKEHHCSCVIVTEDDKPIGIVTERDIVRMVADWGADADLLSKGVAEAMASPVITVNEKDDLFSTLVISRAQRIRHLPVVNSDGIVTGMVTHSNLIKVYLQIFEKQRDIIENSIVERTESLVRANEELKAMALEDPMLGIGNRRAMEVDMQHTHTSAIRYQYPYSVIICDLDLFKSYNDYYGHLAGDEALKAVTSVLKANIRGADRLYRYGGEEFLILLPETEIVGAASVASKIVKKVKTANCAHAKSPFRVITISAGVCSASQADADKSWKDIVKIADTRLYKAKEGGRNRVVSED